MCWRMRRRRCTGFLAFPRGSNDTPPSLSVRPELVEGPFFPSPSEQRSTVLRQAQHERVLMMTDLTNLTVAQIRDGHRAGEFSAVEVAEAFNANVAGAKALNAFIVETPEQDRKSTRLNSSH